MMYIKRLSGGGYDLTNYEDYLNQRRSDLSQRIDAADLLDPRRLSLSDPASFHDARLVRMLLTMDEAAVCPQLELRLKGPFFDRYFELSYDDVISCKTSAPGPEDDLLVHEIRLEGEAVAHELCFDRGHAIEVTCRRIHFRERVIS